MKDLHIAYLPLIWLQLEQVHNLNQNMASALRHKESSFQIHMLAD